MNKNNIELGIIVSKKINRCFKINESMFQNILTFLPNPASFVCTSFPVGLLCAQCVFLWFSKHFSILPVPWLFFFAIATTHWSFAGAFYCRLGCFSIWFFSPLPPFRSTVTVEQSTNCSWLRPRWIPWGRWWPAKREREACEVHRALCIQWGGRQTPTNTNVVSKTYGEKQYESKSTQYEWTAEWCYKIRWETIRVKEQPEELNHGVKKYGEKQYKSKSKQYEWTTEWCYKIRWETIRVKEQPEELNNGVKKYGIEKNKNQRTTTVLQWRPRWTVATGHLATSGLAWNFDTERAFFFCPMLLWHLPKRKGCGWCFWLPSIVSLSPKQKERIYFSQWCTLQGQKYWSMKKRGRRTSSKHLARITT